MELPSAANGATCHHFVADEPTIASLTSEMGLHVCSQQQSLSASRLSQEEPRCSFTGPDMRPFSAATWKLPMNSPRASTQLPSNDVMAHCLSSMTDEGGANPPSDRAPGPFDTRPNRGQHQQGKSTPSAPEPKTTHVNNASFPDAGFASTGRRATPIAPRQTGDAWGGLGSLQPGSSLSFCCACAPASWRSMAHERYTVFETLQSITVSQVPSAEASVASCKRALERLGCVAVSAIVTLPVLPILLISRIVE
ncbi:hypothetical protein BKA58DRAFT_460124 [Alternaria rosae]|uniref:uncharacterized protein n=1 Tax=Alternaria rosae TaxID=1187941 RepID=UPI001E8DC877|nr:uncharacterized protein BKA58DRAFT_460124 [Alternaria rosae]KAH6866426.1 hypothetical protein BKA58DRAFT_460124 [Alternaria rosae]